MFHYYIPHSNCVCVCVCAGVAWLVVGVLEGVGRGVGGAGVVITLQNMGYLISIAYCHFLFIYVRCCLNTWAVTWDNESSDTCDQWRLTSACISTQSGQSFGCPHEENLHSCLSNMRPVKILIRLRIRAVWSESSPVAHVQRFWNCSL